MSGCLSGVQLMLLTLCGDTIGITHKNVQEISKCVEKVQGCLSDVII
jgi:hypothetical protein